MVAAWTLAPLKPYRFGRYIITNYLVPQPSYTFLGSGHLLPGQGDLVSGCSEKALTPQKTMSKNLDSSLTAKKVQHPLQMCENHEFQLLYIQNKHLLEHL